MTFLPLLERELLVRARRGAGYWSRCGVALAGLMLCLPLLLNAGAFAAGGSFSNGLFNGLVAAAFILCCSACLVTARGLAVEQAEGTLGLLFLTRVRAFDLLVGKFGSAGLSSLCSLLAFVPVMMVPLLAGGVTGGEALRKGLALLATLGLALAIGLWAAAFSSPARVMRNAVGVLCVFVFGPYLLGRFAGPELKWLSLPSPLVAVTCAGDAAYRIASGRYWASLASLAALTSLALTTAGLRLRRLAEPEPMAQPRVEGAPAEPAPRRSIPLRRDDSNPVAWLVLRQPGLRARLWAAAALSFVNHNATMFLWRLLPRPTWALSSGPGLAMSAVESALIAWAASRFFFEARHKAEFEVLLTTPLGARQAVSGQWQALQRVLWGPLVLMVLPLGFWVVWTLLGWSNGSLRYGGRLWGPFSFPVDQILSLGLGLLGVYMHVAALCWLGMWFGLKARTQAGAIAWPVVLATALPYLANLLCYTLLPVLLFRRPYGLSFGWVRALSLCTQLANLTVLFGLWLWARRRLFCELSGAAAEGLGFKESLTEWTRGTANAVRNARRWTPS